MRILGGMARQSKMRPTFYRLHAATLTLGTTAETLTGLLTEADAFPERRRLAEGAVYTAACRRYLLLTGTDWKASQQAATDGAWGGQSDHRLRLSVAVEGHWDCSCGYGGTARYPSEAERAHAAHREAACLTRA